MNQRLLLLVVVVAALLGILLYSLGRGKERSSGTLAPARTPDSEEAPARTSELQAPAPRAPEVASERSATPAPEVPAAAPFARDHASFPSEDARWLEVTVRFPAPIPAEDSPALLGFASTETDEQLEESDARDIAQAIDMSERFTEQLDDELAWSRRDLAAATTVRLPFPAQSTSCLLILQSRFFHAEPELVDLETTSATALEPALGAWVTGRCVLPPGAEERSLAAEDFELGFDGRSKQSGFMAADQVDEREVRLANDFTFELRALSADKKYVVSGEADGLVPYFRPGFAVRAGAHETLDVPFQLGATLAGRVLGDDGTALVGAEVSSGAGRMGFFGRGNEATTISDGAFELRGVRPGKVTLHAEREGWLDGSLASLTVADGEVVRGLEVVLGAGRKIAGRVLWPDGTPASMAEIEAYGNSERGYFGEASQANAEASGAFVLGGLEAGPYELIAKATPDAAVRERLGLPPAEEEPPEEAVDAGEIDNPLHISGFRPPGAGAQWKARLVGIQPDTQGHILTLQAPLAVAGSIADDTGAPIAKFRIEATPSGHANWSPGTERKNFESKDGSFEMALPFAGEWSFSASAEGFAETSEPLLARVPLAEPLQLVLARAASVSGRVVDPDGHAVAGAQVTYSTERNSENFVFRGDGEETDASGAFTIPIGAARVTLAADHADWAASEPLALELEPGKPRGDVVLVLRVGARITGEVFDAEGAPEEGQNVTSGLFGFGNSEHSTLTDSAGRFVFEHMTPGRITVSAVPTEEKMFELMATAEDETDLVSVFGQMRMTTVEVADGAETHVVLGAKAKDPVRVTGRITSDGRPLGGAGVMVLAEGGALLTGMKAVRADDGGRYEVVLDRPGDHIFGVSPGEGFGSGTGVQFYVSVPETAEYEIDLALPLGRIKGRVVGPDGAPLGGIQVRVAAAGGVLGIEDIDDSRSRSTDSDGAFAFEHLRAGSYALFAGTVNPYGGETPRYGAAVVDGIEVESDAEVGGIEIRLALPGKLAGTVRDDAGKPVAGASVFVRDEHGRAIAPLSSCRSDAGGRFLYSGLAPGRVSAIARTGLYASVEGDPIAIRAGETSELDLVVGPGTFLVVSLLEGEETVRARLRVLDEEDRVVSDLFSRESLENLFTQGFSSKERRVGPLPPGKYTLIAVSLDGKEAKKSVSVEAGQEERHVKLRLK